MSLQLIAKQMEAKGRDGDSVLVHMTPGEVEGLQKLAESAGGSLSVNPETGLVEANFLKRMLPTLVGVGVGMFAGPMAGAAAGAAVGGYQAKRNDQDVAMGALMGGLGGYGGGTMGAGLMAAGAPAAAAGAGAATGATAAPLTASQTFAQAGQGIKALGADELKRAAFAKSVGMSGLGMAAAPMMAPGKAPGEIPTDDEMYVYDFDYGRTGADSTPTGSSAERTYFQPTYSNRRKIKAEDYLNAAEGGLMSLAEGGSTAAPSQGMTGGSAAAFDYLMGAAPSSAGLPSTAMQAPATLPPVTISKPRSPEADSGKMYTFNPATGAFARNPNFVDPEVAAQAAKDAAAAAELERQRNSGGGGGIDYQNRDFQDQKDAPAPTNDHPFARDVTSAAQGGLMGLAKGGMRSGGFVVPADVVSMIGEGNTDAGYNRIKSMIPDATAIKGKDGGQADTVKTSIEGKQPARVAHGEMYIPPETVKRMGGAKKLYAMMDRVRQQATGSKKQIKPVNLRRAMA
jgi:hypothetical protein